MWELLVLKKASLFSHFGIGDYNKGLDSKVCNYCVVQAGSGNTRPSEISLLQPVQGFVEISKRLDIS